MSRAALHPIAREVVSLVLEPTLTTRGASLVEQRRGDAHATPLSSTWPDNFVSFSNGICETSTRFLIISLATADARALCRQSSLELAGAELGTYTLVRAGQTSTYGRVRQLP